jgi:acyl-CoA synthetase (AMP-forming)/AMP-acid ligase II
MSAHGFTVYDMIARGASVYGDATALVQAERSVSFRELKRRVDVLAGGLAALGIGKGERICVLAQNDAAYLELYGACARQGIIAYPVNWRLTAQEVERVVTRAAPAMMVADASTHGIVAGWPQSHTGIAHWYHFGEPAGPGFKPFDSLYGTAGPPAAADVSAEDPFAVISTAAVDVVPRGAVLTHANVIAANLNTVACIGLAATDHYLLALPLFHITALGTAMAHMHAGGASVLVPRFEAEEAVRLIDRHRITHVSDFPPVLTTLLDAAGKLGSRLPSLKHVSGLDSPQTIQRLHEETGAQFWTGFGQAETSGFVSLQRGSE